MSHIKAWHVILTSFGLAVLFDVFFKGYSYGASIPIFFAILFGLIILLDQYGHKIFNVYESFLAGGMFILSLFYAIRTSEFLLSLNSVAIVYLMLLFLASLYGAKVMKFKIWDFITYLFMDLPLAVTNSAGIIRKLKISKMSLNQRVIRGVILGLVALVVFLLLFAAADPIFRDMLTSIIAMETITNAIEHILIVVFVCLGFMLLLAPIYWKRVAAREIDQKEMRKTYGVESAIALIASNVVFVVFLIVRAAYLWGGEEKISEYGLTYSEYAREGFFQLLVVALIVAAIIWAMRYVRSGKTLILNKVLQVLLIVQTIAVLVASWASLSAYEEAFGFTHLRLFSHYFLVVVAVVLVILAIGVITKKFKTNWVLQGVLMTLVVGLIGLNFMNPDKFIAVHNIERGEAGHEVDYRYLINDLSDDAAPVVIDHVEDTHMGLEAWQTDNYQRALEIKQELSSKDLQTYRGLNLEPEELQARNARRIELNRELKELEDPNVTTLQQSYNKYTKWLQPNLVDYTWFEWNWARERAEEARVEAVDL